MMFLCYGTDSKGFEAKTPFSGGTLIVPVLEFLHVPLRLLYVQALMASI
ncbi:hypothetical protein GX563_08175 [Candidatus Bathyarchaeota archaeon]|nr:hypothetical protein [Candidatus Bathyarchaeota archaeon]